VLEFAAKMKLRKVPGIGGMADTELAAMGIVTGGDARIRAADIVACLGESKAQFFIRASLGIGYTRHSVDEEEHQKSISVDATYFPPYPSTHD